MTDTPQAARILATGQIVAARLAAGYTGILENLITDVRKALEADISAPPPPPVEELKPAVAINRSVRPEAIYCLECGQPHTSIKRHLRTAHQLSPEAYRERWSLRPDYPMVTAAYSERRSQLAKEHGLGRKA